MSQREQRSQTPIFCLRTIQTMLTFHFDVYVGKAFCYYILALLLFLLHLNWNAFCLSVPNKIKIELIASIEFGNRTPSIIKRKSNSPKSSSSIMFDCRTNRTTIRPTGFD